MTSRGRIENLKWTSAVLVIKMDLATALDLSLEDQQEAKFNALRTLHGKKIKQLMLEVRKGS